MKIIAFQTSVGEEALSPDANPPGEALAQSLRNGLVSAGAECDEVDLHEEYGWAWFVTACGARFYVLLIQYAGIADRWVLEVRPQRRFPFLWQTKAPEAELEACRRIHAALRARTDITEVRWFERLADVASFPEGGRAEP